MDGDYQYDLLTAALIGLTVGVGATLLLRRAPSARRWPSAAMRLALAGAGRHAARARLGARRMRRSGAFLDASPMEEARERIASYMGRAREAIDDAVESELRDLRKSIRRHRKRIGI